MMKRRVRTALDFETEILEVDEERIRERHRAGFGGPAAC